MFWGYPYFRKHPCKLELFKVLLLRKQYFFWHVKQTNKKTLVQIDCKNFNALLSVKHFVKCLHTRGRQVIMLDFLQFTRHYKRGLQKTNTKTLPGLSKSQQKLICAQHQGDTKKQFWLLRRYLRKKKAWLHGMFFCGSCLCECSVNFPENLT